MTLSVQNSRLMAVDALRGISLFFILISNIPFAENIDHQALLKSMDGGMYTAWSILVSRKFITIFSILFGFGFYVLMERTSGSSNFRKYFLIRMGLLFTIGFIHGYLFWFGDIIRTYALCGILLLFIYHWSNRKLLITGLLLSILITGIIFIGNASMGWQQYSYDTRIAAEHPVTTSIARYLFVNFRIDPWTNFLQDMPLTISFCMGNIILGYLLGRIGFFQNTSAVPFLRGNRPWVYLLVGIGFSTVFHLVNKGYIELSLPLIWLPFVIIAGMMFQSLAYMTLLLRFFQSNRSPIFTSSVAAVGKMPLTNYLLQTFWYHLLFFHALSPLALYGKIGITATFGLALILFAMQILISKWWLRHYQSGPIEYAWRKLLPERERKISAQSLS